MGSILGGSNKSSQQQQSSGSGTSSSVQGSQQNSQGTSTSQGTSISQGSSSSVGSSFNEGSSSSVGSSSNIGISKSTGASTSQTRAGMSAQEVLDQFAKNKTGTAQFSRENALADVAGVLKTQATEALQSVMPTIAKTDIGAGAYNSTTKELMRNDAEARITGQLSKTALDAITQYGQLSNQAASANNQLISSLASVAGNTGSSDSSSTTKSDSSNIGQSSQNAVSSQVGGSSQISTSQQSASSQQSANAQNTSSGSSFGASESEYEQNSSGSGGSKGGSGLLGLFGGLFADGGEVPDQSNDLLKKFMDASGVSRQIMNVEDMVGGAKNIADGNIKEGTKAFMSEEEKAEMELLNAGAEAVMKMFGSGGGAGEEAALMQPGGDMEMLSTGADMLSAFMGFANGGKVPAKPPASASPQTNQGQQLPTFVFNIGGATSPTEDKVHGYADGGQVSPESQLLSQLHQYASGGKVRSGEADVQKGGKIQGKQSPTGEDNQIIGVAGGEGIIPKDVMEVPGVPELLDRLIKQYHTPVKTGA